MKKFLMLICLAGVAFLSVQSGNVPIQGRLLVGGLKSPGHPVEVFQNPGSIEILFLCNLGKLKITVYDEYGDDVFAQSVDATAGSSLPVSTNGWSAGEYTLTITDGQGGYLEGSFLID